MRSTRLTGRQRELLAAIYGVFEESGKWPRAGALQREFDRAGKNIDVEQVVSTMPMEIHGPVRHVNSELALTFFGMSRVRRAHADIQAYLGLLRVAVNLYLTVDSPKITSQLAIAELGLTPLAAKRLLRMMDGEPPFGGGSSSLDGLNWDRDVAPDVRHFRGVRSLVAYERVREQLRRRRIPVNDPGLQSHWVSVEARLGEMQARLAGASTVDDLQEIGRRTREVVKDAVAVLTAANQSANVGKQDPKGQLDSYLAGRGSVEVAEELRGLLRALLTLANAETHRGRPRQAAAFANVQSAISFVRILQAVEADIAPASPGTPREGNRGRLRRLGGHR